MPILSDSDKLKINLTLATLLASTFLRAITSVTSRVSQIRDSVRSVVASARRLATQNFIKTRSTHAEQQLRAVWRVHVRTNALNMIARRDDLPL